MGAKRKFDIEFRINLSKEMDEVLGSTAERLGVTKTDVMRMLIKAMEIKGIDKIIGD
jgi:predicted DNA-binding protein